MKRAAISAIVLLALAACGDPRGTPAIDAGLLGDGGSEPDGGSRVCTGARAAVSGIVGAEGVVIARDGTIYYSQPGGIGRMTPDGDQDDAFILAADTWGLALDAANERLYAARPGLGRIAMVDLTAPVPAAGTFVMTAGQAAGMTVGPDGKLYFAEFGGGSGGAVYSVQLGGTTGSRVEVTTGPIAGANGLAFLPDGTLLVASYGTGRIHRLTLSGGVETDRTVFASGLGAPDGIAVDAAGRVYVTDNDGARVVRLEADGTNPTVVLSSVPAPGHLAFGTGALCEDLYVAAQDAMQRYEGGAAGGSAVPWQ